MREEERWIFQNIDGSQTETLKLYNTRITGQSMFLYNKKTVEAFKVQIGQNIG